MAYKKTAKHFSALCSSDDDDSSSDSDSEFDFDENKVGSGTREPSRQNSATANAKTVISSQGKDSGREAKFEHDNIYGALHTAISDFELFLQHWHKLSSEKL